MKDISKYQKIELEQAKQKVEKDAGVVLLDVRTKAEYDEKHIAKSILIPLPELEQKAETILKKETEILVYCRSGVRSKQACQILIQLGYTKVFDLGGIINWPYETES